MTKLEAKYCNGCRDFQNCPYIPRHLEHKCPDLDGWTGGYYAANEDTLKWLEEHLEDVLDGAWDRSEVIDAYKKHINEK